MAKISSGLLQEGNVIGKKSLNFTTNSFLHLRNNQKVSLGRTVVPRCSVKKVRSSHPDVFLGKSVLKICSKFTGEHLLLEDL